MVKVTLIHEPDGSRFRMDCGPSRVSLNIRWLPDSHLELVEFRDCMNKCIKYQSEHPGEPVAACFTFNDPEWIAEHCQCLASGE